MAYEPLVFFGSGPVAAKSLELLAETFDIEAVVTKPQPPHHREPFPVLTLAAKLDIKTFTPTTKTELSELFTTKPVASRLGVVIDYGIIIQQDVIDHFPLGIINSHFSLLPEWRGADPITFAILSGQKDTGVSLMRIVQELDEGPLLSLGIYELPPDTTTSQLTEHLIKLSDALLKDALPRYTAGEITPRPQEQVAAKLGRDATPTYSRKLSKADGNLDFTKPAQQLEREVSAFIEWPKSRTKLGDREVVITQSHVENGNGKPGELWRDGKNFGLYTANGIFVIDKLKPAGKAEMTAEAFLAGYGKRL
jgi:methionyl-tRNA formyltransferase